ncbi:PE-PGRS family protein [Kitasatospora sp. NPDC006697]|uniref:5-methylcytosine restriction system specificity protein McrC n=1 Tax=Kitasatospora sp. NPDC006697 TaxID=3364020 RepID=UPI00369E2A62
MPERPTPEISVAEHQHTVLTRDQLTEADLRRLRILQDRGRLRLRQVGSSWRVEVKSAAGVLVLDRVRLLLRPKLPIHGSRLIEWLCYAQGVPVPHEQTLRQWQTGSLGYAGVVLPALLLECRQLLNRGLHRDYRPRERVETALRGRLDVRAQAVRRFGTVDRLHVRTFEREVETWENLVCGAALAAATTMADQPALARALQDTAAAFPRPRLPYTAERHLDRARYTRLNAHYRPAHTWSRLVLGGGGVDDLLLDRGTRAGSVVLHLDNLWERVVRQMAAEAAAETGGRLAGATEGRIVTDGEPGLSRSSFRPDVLLAFDSAAGPSRLLALDAKYKGYQGKRVSAADRHQLLTYIAGYTTPASPLAVIVHPEGPSRYTLTVDSPRGPLGRIEVLGLDPALPPRQAAEPLRRVIAEFAAATG